MRMQQALRTNSSLVCPLLTRTVKSSWSRVFLASLSSPLTRSAIILNPPRVRDFSVSSFSAVDVRFLRSKKGSKPPKSEALIAHFRNKQFKQTHYHKTMFVRVDTLRNWSKDPNRFSRSDHHVIGPYFTDDVFFGRTWDIYHYRTATNDFFLLPILQARQFLQYVHEATDFEKHILDVPEKSLAFCIDPTAPHPPPARLGPVSSKEEFEKMVAEHGLDDEERAAQKKKEKERKAKKKKEKQYLAMMSYTASVRVARQHLGFGMKACPTAEAPGEEVSFDREKPILVAIDVEAWEKDQNRVTEIGIATLDTAKIPPVSELPTLSMAHLDLDNLPDTMPKTRASAICDLIQCRHLRIQDNKSFRNGLWVADAADKFDFGESEWVRLADVPAILGSALRFYDENGVKRKIIIVGHDVKQDFSYLRITGYDVWNIKDLEVIDTTSMHKAVFDIHEARGLSKVLMDMGVIFWNLHNAGNDAAYTLQAFVHLADRGVPARVHSSDPADTETINESPVQPPAPPLQAEDYDYEDLIASGCIKYMNPGQTQLGPRPPKGKKGNRNRRGKGSTQQGNQNPTVPDTAPVDDGW